MKRGQGDTQHCETKQQLRRVAEQGCTGREEEDGACSGPGTCAWEGLMSQTRPEPAPLAQHQSLHLHNEFM